MIDGDTIAIGGRRIELEGIDALEENQVCVRDGEPWRCGEAAAELLEWLVKDELVGCLIVGMDPVTGSCSAGTAHLSATMVRSGYAVATKEGPVPYPELEAQARQERLGMWAGKFDYPSVWRRTERGT